LWPYSCDFRGAGLPSWRLEFRKFRNGVLQYRFDQTALITIYGVVKPAQPLAYLGHRGLVRFCRHDAGDADLDRRLLVREQDFVQPLARPHASEDHLDVNARLETGQADHPLREFHDL